MKVNQAVFDALKEAIEALERAKRESEMAGVEANKQMGWAFDASRDGWCNISHYVGRMVRLLNEDPEANRTWKLRVPFDFLSPAEGDDTVFEAEVEIIIKERKGGNDGR